MGERSRGARHRWLRPGLCLAAVAVALAPGPVLNVLPTETSTAGERCVLSERLQGPSAEHWFGTDQNGCAYLPRVVRGASTSLLVALGATAIAALVAVALGGAAGYYGGVVDAAVSRVTDAVFALPYLVGVILVVSVLAGTRERRPVDVMVALGAVGWPVLLRIVRGSVIEERGRGYVEAARAIGLPDRRILARHVLPNALGPLLAYTSITIGLAVSAEATLTYLGAGLPPGTISWGHQIDQAQRHVSAGQAYHLLLFPSVAVAATTLGFVLVGERLRARLAAAARARDPRPHAPDRGVVDTLAASRDHRQS